MPTLTPEGWTRLRAEWEVGLTSTRALAARHGVSEKAIRKWAADRREPWQRDSEAERRARAAAHAATMRGFARFRSAREIRADPDQIDEFRDTAVSDAAEAIAAANLRHLAMAAELRATFDALSQALTYSLAEGEFAGRARLVGTARCLMLLARVALAIQQIERTALGMKEDASGLPQAHSDPADRTNIGLPFRIQDLSTAELSALARLAELADQARHSGICSLAFGRDGLPVPPTAPSQVSDLPPPT
jgi:hypothetical protein